MRAYAGRAASLVERHSLAFALGVGMLLRLIAIQSRSLQYDDVFSIFLSERSLPEILTGTAADTMPPLYYFLLHFWMFVSEQAWFIRLLSVLLSLAGIALLYLVVEQWLGKPAAGWAALLAAVSPLSIYHGQDVRMYALLVLAQLGYLWCFTHLLREDGEGKTRWAGWAGLVLCGAAAMYTHNVGVFALSVPDLYLVFRRRWRLLLKLLAAQALTGLLALPWLLLLPGQIAKVQKAWTLPRPGPAELLQAVIMFVASLPLPFPLLALALFLSLAIAVILFRELWRDRRAMDGTGFWLLLLLAPPALLYAASYVMKPVFIPRAFLISSMAYSALCGVVIARTWAQGPGKLLAGALLLAAAVSLPSYYTFAEHPRSPYREAAAYLAQVVKPGEVIVHETKLSYFPAHFYNRALPQVFLADPPGTPNDTFEPGSQQAMQMFPVKNLAAASENSQGVYFLTFSQTFREYAQMGLPEHPNIAWLDAHFHRTGRVVFNDLEIYHYERQ